MITPGTYPISSGVATIEPDPWTDGVFLLKVNGVESSQLNPDRPETLGFEYMRWSAHVLAHRFTPDARLRVLHLGGAGCTFARWVAHMYPHAHQLAVELDAGLAELARTHFDLPRAPQLKIRVGEAGQVLSTLREGTREVIVRDVFAPAPGQDPAAPDALHVTPPHLTGLDAAAHAARVLIPGGVYLLNIGGGPDLTSVRREVAALAATFAHVEVMADPPMLKGRRRGNVVAAASAEPLAAESVGGRAGLARTLLSDASPAHLVDDVARFVAGVAPETTPLA